MDVQPQIIHVVIYNIFCSNWCKECLIQFILNPIYTTLAVFLHGLDDSPFGKTREETLENIESLNCCDTDSVEFDYGFEIDGALRDLVQVTDLFDELKMIGM